MKNFVIRPGFPLRTMEPNWPDRAMQFTDLPSGDLNMNRYVELLLMVGYPAALLPAPRAPRPPRSSSKPRAPTGISTRTSANGIGYVRDHLLITPAAGSFEDGMGA